MRTRPYEKGRSVPAQPPLMDLHATLLCETSLHTLLPFFTFSTTRMRTPLPDLWPFHLFRACTPGSRLNEMFDKDVEALATAAQPKLDVPNVSLSSKLGSEKNEVYTPILFCRPTAAVVSNNTFTQMALLSSCFA